MKAWCDHCNEYVNYSQTVTHMEAFEIKDTVFKANQTYGICPICGEEVLSNELADSNVQKAHNAYRRALDSITADEIRDILERYNIGAQPLSLLLGWGANTIERQMKHTIPSKEHARRLRELKNPSVMYTLLENNRGKIKDIAYNKAHKAVFDQLEFDVRQQIQAMPANDSFKKMDSACLAAAFVLVQAKDRTMNLRYNEDYRLPRSQYQLAFSGR